MFDRIASVGGWLHGVDERDIGTELPLTRVDFEMDVSHFVFPLIGAAKLSLPGERPP